MNTGKKFLEDTKYHNMEIIPQEKGNDTPKVESGYNEENLKNLPDPRHVDGDRPEELLELINKRRSIRAYSKNLLSETELSYLLWCTQGVKQILNDVTLRTVPSAGARHAFETFLFIKNVKGYTQGLYRFVASRHGLVLLSDKKDLYQQLTSACLNQSFVDEANVIFIWTAVPYRMTWRYGERGYRYLLLDAGHVCQNLYLAGEAINCGTCAIAAFDDDQVNNILGVDGDNQFTVYIAALGKKQE